MRILITIPHYYKKGGDRTYGSGREERIERVGRVRRTITALWEKFMLPKNWIYQFYDSEQSKIRNLYKAADTDFLAQLEIVLCTDGKNHLLDELELPKNYFHHQPIKLDDPRYLGFGCHRVLQSNADKFDFYGYMEDDLVIHDSFFFQKLSWFARKFGSQFLLQPHRYNRKVTPFDKDYLDMEFAKPAWNFKRSEKKLTATFLGEPLNFFSAANPHAACFFLTREQYRLMSDREDYAKPSGEFFTPLESAASLDISKTFYVYRVDFAAADFFSVEHIGERPYRIPGSEIDQADFAKYGYQFY